VAATDIASRDEVLRLLTARARAGRRTAQTALLRYLGEPNDRRDEDDPFADLDGHVF
jgi:hypothetical protein